MKNTQKSRGFTLVELLVVIAIIAVLVAVSIGGIFRYRKAADKTVVLGNMRNLMVANAGYASDHNGEFVGAYSFDEDDGGGGDATLSGSWNTNYTFISQLTGVSDLGDNKWNLENLPPSVLDPTVYRAKEHRYDQLDASYGYNQQHMPPGWGHKGTTSTYRVSQLTDPARTFSFISCTDWNAKFSGRELLEGRGSGGGQDS